MTGQRSRNPASRKYGRADSTVAGSSTAGAQKIEDQPAIKCDSQRAELDADFQKCIVKVEFGLMKIADALFQIGLHLAGPPAEQRLGTKHVPAGAVHGHAKFHWTAFLQAVGDGLIDVLKS